MGSRILVDLLGFTGTRGGTETYVRELVTRLPERMPDVTFAALANRTGAAQVESFFPGRVKTLEWVGAGRVSWAAGEVFGANAIARRSRADLIWTPANFGPLRRGVTRVVTVHDVIYHEVRGGLRDRAMRTATSWLMKRSALSADTVIAISDTAAQAITANIGVPPECIRTVLNGSSDPAPPEDPWTVLAGFGLPGQRSIALTTGNRLPHKNFEGLLRALATMDASDRPLTVITGGGTDDPLRRVVVELNLGADVVLPGWVTPDQLEALYAVADLYICPSLAEGFGLPVVDALRRGCAVLANDIPVLREVGGSVASFADALSPTDFAQAIARAQPLANDATRRAAGLTWAENFTWDAAADGTAGVLTYALETGGAQRHG